MKFSQRNHSRRTGAATLCLVGALAIAASAQNAAVPAQVSPVSQTLRTLDLQQEPALRAPVSFEANRLSLAEVLADLQKQTNVKLNARDETKIADFKVTAHVEAMRLADVLSSLSRLYGVEWSKDGNSYVLIAPEPSGLDRSLLQLGDPNTISEEAQSQSWRARRGINWLEQITPFATETELRSAQGVALSAMTPELTDRLRHPLEIPAAARVLKAYAEATSSVLENYKLRLSVPLGKTTSVPTTTITIVDAAGKQVAPVARVLGETALTKP